MTSAEYDQLINTLTDIMGKNKIKSLTDIKTKMNLSKILETVNVNFGIPLRWRNKALMEVCKRIIRNEQSRRCRRRRGKVSTPPEPEMEQIESDSDLTLPIPHFPPYQKVISGHRAESLESCLCSIYEIAKDGFGCVESVANDIDMDLWMFHLELSSLFNKSKDDIWYDRRGNPLRIENEENFRMAIEDMVVKGFTTFEFQIRLKPPGGKEFYRREFWCSITDMRCSETGLFLKDDLPKQQEQIIHSHRQKV